MSKRFSYWIHNNLKIWDQLLIHQTSRRNADSAFGLGAARSEGEKYWQIAAVKDAGVYRTSVTQASILMRFSAHQRLRKARDFKDLRETGLRVNCGCFIAVLRKNESGPRRLGVVASRKVGNAVKRNRAKRVFREIFRLNQEHLPPSSDLMIIVRPGFDSYSFSQLTARFIRLCENYNN